MSDDRMSDDRPAPAPGSQRPELPDPASAESLVEELGDLFDRIGSPRISGRIVGWLLICDPPHQSAAEIQDAVQASKGSVSTVTRHLVESGLVERLGLPADRKTYYRLRGDGWATMMESKLHFTRAFQEIATRRAEEMDGDHDVSRLRDMSRFYGFMAEALDGAIQRWRREAADG